MSSYQIFNILLYLLYLNICEKNVPLEKVWYAPICLENEPFLAKPRGAVHIGPSLFRWVSTKGHVLTLTAKCELLIEKVYTNRSINFGTYT